MYFKSIKTKLVTAIALVFIAVTIIVSSVSGYVTYKSTLDSMEITITAATQAAAGTIEKQISVFNQLLSEIATAPSLTNSLVPLAVKQKYVEDKTEQYKETYNCLITYSGPEGKDIITSTNVSNKEFFMKAMQGEENLSDPVIREDTGTLSFAYAVPVKSGSEISGVLYMLFDYEVMYKIVAEAAIGKTGTAYVINKNDYVTVTDDKQKVIDQYSLIEQSKQDKSLLENANLEQKAAQGETGFGKYTVGGERRVLAYTPIEGANGWSFIATAAQSEFASGLVRSIGLNILSCLIVAVIAVITMIRIAASIARPLKSCANRLELLAQGDLRSPVPIVKSKDETGILAKATEEIVDTLREIIGDEDYLLGEMGAGNFNVKTKVEEKYVGDFNSILNAVRNINDSLSTTLIQISQASNQVSTGSDQVSSGAQALSQGATEQAGAIEELAATITEISKQVKENAQNAQSASQSVEEVGEEIDESNRQMQTMILAMSEISNTSKRIEKVIKTIEDIAFQTNILALNAAVEAARAGEAGKGFAVVADEVRNLAGKSAEAAKGTTDLIQSSIKAVENGTRIADATGKSLTLVATKAKDVVEKVDNIANASNEQANSISQITIGVDQISSVVQTNSATAEESAAASEELSSQSQMLKDLVSHFRLKKNILSTYQYEEVTPKLDEYSNEYTFADEQEEFTNNKY